MIDDGDIEQKALKLAWKSLHRREDKISAKCLHGKRHHDCRICLEIEMVYTRAALRKREKVRGR